MPAEPEEPAAPAPAASGAAERPPVAQWLAAELAAADVEPPDASGDPQPPPGGAGPAVGLPPGGAGPAVEPPPGGAGPAVGLPPSFEPVPFQPPPAAPPPAAGPPPAPHAAPAAPAARAATRLGCAALELVLFVAGLGVAWVVWWVALWRRGSSPARALLHLELAPARPDGPAVDWQRTAIRELAAKLLLPVAPVSALVALRDGRGLWDRMAGTTVTGPTVAAPPPADEPAPEVAVGDQPPSPGGGW